MPAILRIDDEGVYVDVVQMVMAGLSVEQITKCRCKSFKVLKPLNQTVLSKFSRDNYLHGKQTVAERTRRYEEFLDVLDQCVASGHIRSFTSL